MHTGRLFRKGDVDIALPGIVAYTDRFCHQVRGRENGGEVVLRTTCARRYGRGRLNL